MKGGRGFRVGRGGGVECGWNERGARFFTLAKMSFYSSPNCFGPRKWTIRMATSLGGKKL